MEPSSKVEAIAYSDQDKQLMREYGITSQVKVLFHFGGYTYERLADAVNYAKNQRSAPRKKNTRKGDATRLS